MTRACLPGRLARDTYRKRTFMVSFVSVMVIICMMIASFFD
jgi:hypothetical protein